MLHSGDLAWSGSPHEFALVAVRQHWDQLARFDRELGRFSLDTAIPDDFDIFLARRLSGLTDVGGHVSRLEAEGLIMRTATSNGARYRYHPLLREVLRAECVRKSKVEFRRLSAVAAIAADERGHPLAALRHSIEAEDYELTSAIILHGGIALIRGTGVAAILRPEVDGPLQLGALSLAAAVSVVHGQMPEAARALRVIDESGWPVEVLNSYSGSLAHLARAIMGAEAGDMRRVHAHVEALDAHMPTLEYRLLFAAVQALAALWDGDLAQALHDLAALRREDAPRARISRSDERILGVTRALLYSVLSETGAAQDEVRRLPVNDGLRILLDAHLMLIGRRPELAFPRLAQLAPGEHDDRLRAMRDILMACAALASGDGTAAATALRRYAATVSANELMTPLLLVPVEHRDDLLDLAGSLGGAPLAALQRLRELPPVFRLTRIRASLTPREQEILEGLRATSSLTTIAERLGVPKYRQISGENAVSQARCGLA